MNVYTYQSTNTHRIINEFGYISRLKWSIYTCSVDQLSQLAKPYKHGAAGFSSMVGDAHLSTTLYPAYFSAQKIRVNSLPYPFREAHTGAFVSEIIFISSVKL